LIKILNIITGLDTGGAEIMLYKLMSGLNRKRFLCRVISIGSFGVVGKMIQELGIRVDTLGLNQARPNPFALFKLIRILGSWRPDIVQTWLYHADLLGTLACMVSGRPSLIWNIRCANMDFSLYRRTTKWVMRCCAAISCCPDMIISNSHAAMDYHLMRGYRPRRSRVIPNGFDLECFKPDESLNNMIRQELRIPEHAPCVGMIARFDPMKDHATFFSAAELIGRKQPDAHFILCGEGMVWENQQIQAYLSKSRSSLKVHLLGPREDINRIMAGLDIFVLSSYGESFPNVIGEAMACGVPCVATDVGDSQRIIGGTGKIVPRKDPLAMANSVLELLNLPDEEFDKLRMVSRERIRKRYSLDSIVADYENMYWDIAGRSAGQV